MFTAKRGLKTLAAVSVACSCTLSITTQEDIYQVKQALYSISGKVTPRQLQTFFSCRVSAVPTKVTRRVRFESTLAGGSIRRSVGRGGSRKGPPEARLCCPYTDSRCILPPALPASCRSSLRSCATPPSAGSLPLEVFLEPSWPRRFLVASAGVSGQETTCL